MQESVSYAKPANAHRIQYNLDTAAEQFKADTNAIPTIDVVRKPDGRLTALDNSRLTVRVDQGGQIHTNIFSHDEVIAIQRLRAVLCRRIPLTAMRRFLLVQASLNKFHASRTQNVMMGC